MKKVKALDQDKRYAALIDNYQRGNFAKAQPLLNNLLEEFPNSPELLQIKNNLGMKTKQLKVSKKQDTNITWKQILIWSVVVIVVVAIGYGVFLGVRKYNQILSDRTQEIETIRLAEETNNFIEINLNSASKLVESGRYLEAIEILKELEDLIPDDPNYNGLLKQAYDGVFLISVYEEALQMGEQLNFSSALEQLEIIKNVDPDFRDVQILINDYIHEIELISFLVLADEAYENSDWDIAIVNYEEYLLGVENNQKLEEKKKLYNSYMNVINAYLSEEVLDIEIIEESERLLSKARTLYLHNTIEYSFEDNKRIQDLLIAKFITLAEQSLEEAPENINSIKNAEYYYSKALQLQPYSDDLIEKYVIISNFLAGYNDFIDGSWVDAESNLKLVYESDPDFAGGLIDVLLYETYTVMGNLYEEIEYFVSANNNYELAAVVANNNPDNELRVFEVSVNQARMQAKFGDFRASALKFQEAFDISGFYNLSQFYGGTYGENLSIAYQNIDINYFYTAYQYFIDAIEETPDFIDQEVIWLQENDSLIKLCLEHSSTFSFIFEFNDFNYSMLPIVTGTGVIVPSLP